MCASVTQNITYITVISRLEVKHIMLYTRTILEYASTVWEPYTKSSIGKLEAIQRRAARFVVSNYDYSSSVNSVLNQLNWLSLDARRQVSRLVMFYKIVHQSVTLALPNEIVLFNTITRGHNMRYRTPFSKADVHKNSFFQQQLDCGILYQRILSNLVI